MPRFTPSSRRRLAVPAATALGLILAIGAGAPSVAAGGTEARIDFTAPGYTPGQHSPKGQNGWGAGTDFDYALEENDDFAAAGLPSGGRSLRVSNATIANSYLTTPEIESAGESAGWNTFEAGFTVASATGAIQPGLNVAVNLDAASRYGGVINLRHTAAGLEIGSFWVPADAADASLANWRSAVLATVPADRQHRVRIVETFLTERADHVAIYVDDALVSAGSGITGWERYHSIMGSGGDRSVDELSFQASKSAPSSTGISYDSIPAAPSTAGNGLLFTDIAYWVRTDAPPVPTAPPVLPSAPAASPDTDIDLSTSEVKSGTTFTFSADGFLPYENVFLTVFSTPYFAGWAQADAGGVVTGTITLPDDLEAGSHTLQITGESGRTAVSAFSFVALAATGAEPAPTAALAGCLLATGITVLGITALLGRRTRRSRHSSTR